ncbi:hypothetical protein Q9L58_006993 [Maublancomyces gigas]|uniref:Uncharacterized protein n=1 Tax=Discina gigas TaxID=1032678 RepID=A0ABR3GDX0_9PEZI
MSDPPSTMPPAPPRLHDLVAFASHYLSKSTGKQPLTRAVCYTPTDKPGVLDAIATVCVTPQHPEPVAVSVTIDRRSRQVHLLISQTVVDNLDDSRLAYIRKTWTLLHELSAEYTRIRRDPTEASPRHSRPKEREALFHHIYYYCGEQVLQMVHDWWPKLDDIHRELGRSLRSKAGKPEGLKSRFMKASLALRQAVQIMGCDLSLLTSQSWKRLNAYMDLAALHTRILLRQWPMCEDWGMEFKDSVLGPSAARCALSTLTSLQRHLNALCSFALSPRPGDIFSYALHISFLPCPSTPTILPSDWTPMLRHLTHNNYSLDEWRASESIKLAGIYKPTQHCAPHPECNIISHLHSQRSLNPPPLAAIGISSPACAACALWIDTFHGRPSRNSYYHDYSSNQRVVRRKGKYFRYRGSSDAWCWPWTLPGPIGAKEAILVKEVEGRCMAFLSDTGVFECWSSRGRGPIHDDELKDIRVAIDAWMAEREMEEECQAEKVRIFKERGEQGRFQSRSIGVPATGARDESGKIAPEDASALHMRLVAQSGD